MRALVLAASVVLASCASVAGAPDQPPPFATAPAAVTAPAAAANYPIAVDLPAGSYRLDPRHASVNFRIRHMDLAWFTARFDTRDATLVLDPADPSRSQLTASVDATSINTGVLNAQGERAFDRTIGRALGSDTAPAITFTSTAIQRTGKHTAQVTGDLSMNGQTHPVTLDVTFDGGAVDPLRGGSQVLGFSAHGTIDRTQWGVTQWQAFTGDDVQIVIEAELVHG
ncbi:MAG: YceI family protein [Hyphomonadaceae bacterium]